jgi:hypothetical protein
MRSCAVTINLRVGRGGRQFVCALARCRHDGRGQQGHPPQHSSAIDAFLKAIHPKGGPA